MIGKFSLITYQSKFTTNTKLHNYITTGLVFQRFCLYPIWLIIEFRKNQTCSDIVMKFCESVVLK